MKKFLTCLLLCFSSVSSAAESIDEAVKEVGEGILSTVSDSVEPTRLAVLSFSLPDGSFRQISQVIMNELAGHFVRSASDKFIVTERSRIESVLGEFLRSGSDLFEEESVKKIGGLANAETLVIGELTPERDRVRLTARLVSVDDIKVLASASAWFPLTPTVQDHIDTPYRTVFFKPTDGQSNDPRNGTWVGQGWCGESRFGVSIALNFYPNNRVYGLNVFYPETAGAFEPGVLMMEGNYEEASGKLVLEEKSWLYQPAGMSAMDIEGSINIADGRFEGEYNHEVCSKIKLQKYIN